MAVRSKANARQLVNDGAPVYGEPNSTVWFDSDGRAHVIRLPAKKLVDPTKLDKPIDHELDVTNAIAHAKAQFQKAVFEELGTMDATETAETVRKEIYTMLATQKKQMVMKLLGFDTDFGRAELNRNNGSALANQMLDTHVRTAATAWLNENFATGELEKLVDKAAKASLRKSFIDSFRWKFENMIREHAERMAAEQVKRLMTEFTEQFQMGDPK